MSLAFSRPGIRHGYLKLQTILERVVGIALAGFGLRLIYQALRRN